MSCIAVEEAILLSCDIPTRQYILHVDREQQRDHKKESFVIRQLDPTHLYVKARVTPAPAWAMLGCPPVRCHLRRLTAWHCWRASLRSCRRCDDPCIYAHATPHHHQPPVIHPQDHNTFTRNDAGPGLSSAGASPAPLSTRCPKPNPISRTLPILTACSLALAQAAKRLARRRRPRARRPLKRRRRRPLRRQRRQARSPSHSLKCHEGPARCSIAAELQERRAPPPKGAGGPAGT